MKQYRRKFILEDGRKVYASKRGEIALVSQKTVDNSTGFADMAYSPDLMMESDHKPYIRVVAQVFEPESSPVDLKAYVAGTRLS